MYSSTAERLNSFVLPELPELDLRHLYALTDDTGILQHARYAIPDRNHGYCVDDNARALIVVCRHHALRYLDVDLQLVQRYLAFLSHAFNPAEGRFRNFMSYDRQWLESHGSEDSHGRAIWGLGVAIASVQTPGYRDIAARLIEDAAPALDSFSSPRAWAYALLGLQHYVEEFPGNTAIIDLFIVLAARLHTQFESNCDGDWEWCEDVLSYSNAVLPYALLVAGRTLADKGMIDSGIRALDWLVGHQTSSEGHLSIIGNDGWLRRSGERAHFDQQPVDAMGMVLATIEAFGITKDERWRNEACRSFEWFTGANDLGLRLHDESTGGCRDGLHPDRVNMNQGAESTISWLVSLLAMYDVLEPVKPTFAIKNAYANHERRTSVSAFVRTNGHSNGRSH